MQVSPEASKAALASRQMLRIKPSNWVAEAPEGVCYGTSSKPRRGRKRLTIVYSFLFVNWEKDLFCFNADPLGDPLSSMPSFRKNVQNVAISAALYEPTYIHESRGSPGKKGSHELRIFSKINENLSDPFSAILPWPCMTRLNKVILVIPGSKVADAFNGPIDISLASAGGDMASAESSSIISDDMDLDDSSTDSPELNPIDDDVMVDWEDMDSPDPSLIDRDDFGFHPITSDMEHLGKITKVVAQTDGSAVPFQSWVNELKLEAQKRIFGKSSDKGHVEVVLDYLDDVGVPNEYIGYCRRHKDTYYRLPLAGLVSKAVC
ncbi:Uu.00g145380.m01.CDS01 [Anthostomella pinea]|uniref:Uu.00g145380.m01.CDS01 n=1 Tax=Anthostomella pinea TaxID=933095 RepID=A0AAI8YLU1_9PEZI|nr:Uu.00g145380.m01.CDS01 [Anthostomella pinea]